MNERAPVDCEGVAQRWLLILMLSVMAMASLLALKALPPSALFSLGNLVGPTTDSLLRGGGLTTCTEAMGTPGNPICFHSGRMPMASLVVGFGIKILGDRPVRVDLFKMILFLIPIGGAAWLTLQMLPGVAAGRIAVLLLLTPFGMTAFLADVVNLQVEEGYCYSLLALAFAMLLFHRKKAAGGWGRAVLFAVAVDGIYLAKSSMVTVVLVLTVSYVLTEKGWGRQVLVGGLVALAPVGWALHQHHASGRYSLGTSLDGINLHKGNNAEFLQLYPPPGGGTLDAHDRDLNAGMRFADEWSFNDFHAWAAAAYLRTHPRETLEGDMRKLWVIFFSVKKSGAGQSHGGMLVAETVGLIVFRLMLWASILGAVRVALRPVREGDRGAGLIFLGLVAAVALPYVVGFAYTRHVSVLIYPAAMMCCWLHGYGCGEPSRRLGVERGG